MNGLEEIVLTIQQKSDERCKEIIEKANAKAEEIKAAAEKTAAAEGEKIIAEANRRCERTVDAAKSAAQSNGLKEMLKFKSQTVKEVIEKTVSDLDALGDEEYFAVIEKLVFSNFHKNESGEIRFGEKDTNRIPADFLKNVNEALKKEGAELSLGTAADIKNGFILDYGDIEENCSFDAIVSSKEDALKDGIASILFG